MREVPQRNLYSLVTSESPRLRGETSRTFFPKSIYYKYVLMHEQEHHESKSQENL